MTATLLDFTQRRELSIHAELLRDLLDVAEPLGIDPLIVGAFARDLNLLYRHGIETQRQTEDLDLALAISDWQSFEALKRGLIGTTRFSASAATPHRLMHKERLPVDLVPFGNVETLERKIAWPPRGEIVMDVFGFREAQASALDVALPDGVHARVVSLPAIALLKMICWRNRHYESPRKDAHDLLLIVRHYLAAGNQGRLFEEFLDWTLEDSFDYELAGARMLGHDVQKLLDTDGVRRVVGLLSEQTSTHAPGRLPAEMLPNDQDRARQLLDAMLVGMSSGRPK
jgi:predicted nucleotidyltransferase